MSPPFAIQERYMYQSTVKTAWYVERKKQENGW